MLEESKQIKVLDVIHIDMKIMKSRIHLLLVCLLLTACGAKPSLKTEIKPTRTLDIEPMVIEVSGKGENQKVVAYDSESLFESAKKAYENRLYVDCVEKYDQLLEKFPQSLYAHASQYNLGICLEELRQHRRAATHFRIYSQTSKETRDQLDGLFRLGFNLLESDNYSEALLLYDSLLKRDGIQGFDRAECLIRRAIARTKGQSFGEAEKDLKAALKHINTASEGYVMGNDLAAESYFRRGEIYYTLSRKVKLKLPLKKMRSNLKEKVRFFKQAQRSFLDSLNVREPFWATAAGMKLGELYEQFYVDVLQAEIPSSMGIEERKVYFAELRKQLQPLLKHSVSIYERNISMSVRLGTSNRWVNETEKRLQKLRSLIETNERKAKEDEGDAPKSPSKTIKRKSKAKQSKTPRS